MYINERVVQPSVFRFYQVIKSFKTTLIFTFCVAVTLGFIQYNSTKADDKQTLSIISNPKVNDIYFLDFRLLSDQLRPKEKYRIAKVVDITGEIVTLVYGGFFYQRQHAATNSIIYGQLSYKEYFEPKRYDVPLEKIKNMANRQAIYLAKRPIHGKLFGRVVGPENIKKPSSHLIYGKKENTKGEAFLKEKFSETNFKKAFELFQQSSNLGYDKGQVNLAEMYINANYVEKDFVQALYWLKKSSLQSYKPAILKYGIVCKQVKSCNIADF
jgi:hypothetical protein